MDRGKGYGVAAALLLVGGAVAELLRVVFDSTAGGFTAGHQEVISIVLAALWGTTAFAVLARHREGWLAAAAWVLSIASTVAVLAHAFLLRVGDAWYGGLYLLSTPILAFLLWNAIGRRSERRRLRREARHEA